MRVDPLISVVVTNYNTTALTIRCLEGIKRHLASRPAEVVVVDDASEEKIGGVLPEGTVLVENGTNQGYVRSVNIGVARATGDLVLLLDSDAVPASDVFSSMADAFARRPRLGALGFRLVDRVGRPTGATQPEPTAIGLALGQALEARMIGWLSRSSKAWFTIHSCAIAFRRRVFADLGGFDEGFDFLDADTDFSMRLRRAGWDLEIAEDAHILHEGSGSPQTTARRVVRHHANRWRLLEKHGLISHPRLLKGTLAMRHAAELLWLSGPSRIFQKESITRADKLDGRRQLMASVWRAYQKSP
jgi:GT2 family glycosyltransferase